MKQDEQLKTAIQKYLDEAKMMQLATASPDGTPWSCNVWFACDEALTIYWISATTRRHSQEILENSRVAASICLVREPHESDKGALQIEGTATRVKNPVEIARALKLYSRRGVFSTAQVKKFMADITQPHSFYKITPTTITLFDKTKKEYRL